jgi:hypothetical protein
LFLVWLRVKTLEKVFVEEAKLLFLSVRFQNLEELSNAEHHDKPVVRLKTFGDDFVLLSCVFAL